MPVAGEGHEIERNFSVNLANQIGKKNGRTLENSNEVDALALIILGNLVTHLADALLDRAAPQENFQVLLPMAMHRNRLRQARALVEARQNKLGERLL